MYGKDKDERGGFNFDHVRRNNMLHSSGLQFKAAMKTGTTISGIVFKDGVVLGADTRSTNGDTVADKNCEKIHYIAPNIYCCGAGTAADTEAVTGASSHPPCREHSNKTAPCPRRRSACSSFVLGLKCAVGNRRGRDLSLCQWRQGVT